MYRRAADLPFRQGGFRHGSPAIVLEVRKKRPLSMLKSKQKGFREDFFCCLFLTDRRQRDKWGAMIKDKD
ncbi:MAG: hypothetical protein A2Z25_03835 [Planctomycetes bacterium RBG_16_55_9]|nr:MAG: hypothetical protein A2Z25_03835 [Planctomycetes bacterium RBG_16_55_9]